MENLEGVEIFIRAGHYETSEDGEYSFLTTDFAKKVEVTASIFHTFAVKPLVEKEILSRVHYALKEIGQEYLFKLNLSKGMEHVSDTRNLGETNSNTANAV